MTSKPYSLTIFVARKFWNLAALAPAAAQRRIRSFGPFKITVVVG